MFCNFKPHNFKIIYSLGDLVAFFDRIDTLPTSLDSSWFASHFDFKPYSTDTRWLHLHTACLAANPSVSLVATEETGKSSIPGEFFVYYIFHNHIPPEFNTSLNYGIHGHGISRNAPLHVRRATPEYSATIHSSTPRGVLPRVVRTGWNHINVAIVQKGSAASFSFTNPHNVWSILVLCSRRAELWMLLQLL